MAEMSKETEQKITQLQLMEQSMQNFMVQKQQFQAQLIEIESALSELNNAKDAFKIVGNIMVSAKKEDLEKDLSSKKEMVELRIKNIEKQEKQVKDKASAMQEEVMKKLQKDKK